MSLCIVRIQAGGLAPLGMAGQAQADGEPSPPHLRSARERVRATREPFSAYDNPGPCSSFWGRGGGEKQEKSENFLQSCPSHPARRVSPPPPPAATPAGGVHIWRVPFLSCPCRAPWWATERRQGGGERKTAADMRTWSAQRPAIPRHEGQLAGGQSVAPGGETGEFPTTTLCPLGGASCLVHLPPLPRNTLHVLTPPRTTPRLWGIRSWRISPSTFFSPIPCPHAPPAPPASLSSAPGPHTMSGTVDQWAATTSPSGGWVASGAAGWHAPAARRVSPIMGTPWHRLGGATRAAARPPPSPPSTPTPLSPPQPGGSYCTTQGGWCPASCGSQTSLAGSGRTSTEAAAAQTVWGAVLDLVDGSPSRWGPARVCVASALR